MVAKVVHAADSGAGKGPGEDDIQRLRMARTGEEVKGDQQDHDREEKGEGCEDRAVVDLSVWVTIVEYDGPIRNKMHSPDARPAHRDT